MKTAQLLAASALVLAAPAAAQTQPSSITADLNRAPAAAARTPQTQTPRTPTPETQPAPTRPAQTRPAPVRAAPQPAAPPVTQAQPEEAAEDEAADVEAETEADAAAAEPAAEPAPPPPPPLTAAQIAALPFRLDLPAGLTIVEGRSSDDFDLWTVRRDGGPPLVSIYAGPRSSYPIYAGREVTAGGRTSITLDQGQGVRAMEHIFLRATAPREVHVWVGSVDDADIAAAEAIAQSVDPK